MRKILIVSTLLLLILTVPAHGKDYACAPTAEDAQGPFYRPGAPLRNSIGSGYLLVGTVKSAADCEPIGGAKIEAWMTGPDGRYDERWRATLMAAENGDYYLESHVPGAYGSRPPHIHLLVTAPGFAELITQHYPRAGSGMAIFDLVLIPAP